jgi:Transposase/Helix-turn-helix domain of resolvase
MQHPSLLDAHDVPHRGHESTVALSAPLLISRLVGEVSRSHYWCASGSVQRLCVPNTSRAERFPEVVQRYARMTDRLIKALQSTGVLTNGADAAQIASSFGMPTTAKTIIRRVLQLPLPSEGSVHKVGVDEWAWKKGHRYGTILVDLEKRRVVQLLADRSVETSKAWLRKHPEIDLVSRDRGQIFREAATEGAPQAKQVVDRYHLQKNFAEALEKFFRKQERVLKKATGGSTGKAHPAERLAVPEKASQERRARHRQRVRLHKRIWKLYREGYHKEQIAQIVGVSSRSVYRTLEQETPPPPRRRSRSSSIVDPYLSYLTSRWNQGCHNVTRLYEEIVAASDTRGRSGRFRCDCVLFGRKSHAPSPNRRSSGTNLLRPEALRS